MKAVCVTAFSLYADSPDRVAEEVVNSMLDSLFPAQASVRGLFHHMIDDAHNQSSVTDGEHSIKY